MSTRNSSSPFSVAHVRSLLKWAIGAGLLPDWTTMGVKYDFAVRYAAADFFFQHFVEPTLARGGPVDPDCALYQLHLWWEHEDDVVLWSLDHTAVYSAACRCFGQPEATALATWLATCADLGSSAEAPSCPWTEAHALHYFGNFLAFYRAHVWEPERIATESSSPESSPLTAANLMILDLETSCI